MAIPSKVKKLLAKDKLIVFGTSNKNGKPNLIFVASCGLFNNKLLIADCQMNKTLKNLKGNKAVALCAFDKQNYFQIKGKALYTNKGKWFKLVKKYCEDTRYKPKGAVLVTIKEVYNLDNGKRINIKLI
ncbi:MAG: pyridoxamine 5'-phosphate oxidase family protein [Candidatus Pacearchaeota archaeon]